MKVNCTDEFWELFHQQIPDIQKKVKKALRFLRDNPQHPGLQLKCVDPQMRRYSLRIDLNYRALGLIRGDTITLDWIGPHDEYIRRIRK